MKSREHAAKNEGPAEAEPFRVWMSKLRYSLSCAET